MSCCVCEFHKNFGCFSIPEWAHILCQLSRALPCPALPCPALPCPALPCPAPAGLGNLVALA